VPPPPVAGAAVGNGLAARLRVADGDAARLGVADADADAARLADADADADAARLADADADADADAARLGVVPLALPLGRLVGVAEPVTAGENEVGVGEGEDAVQAETDAEAIMAKVAQPATVSLTLSPVPVMTVRIVMGSSCGWQPPEPFPGPGTGREIAGRPGRWPPAEGRSRKRRRAIKGKAHGRHKHAMACSSLEY
jgi:hypothetical protein